MSDVNGRPPSQRDNSGEDKAPLSRSNSFSNGSFSFPRTPSAAMLNGLGGYFSMPFERMKSGDDEHEQWAGLTLLDTIETLFDARVDLLEREFKKQKDRLQTRATALARTKIRPNGDELDKEVQKLKLKLSGRLAKLNEAWDSAKVVRTREKLTFFLGVMTTLCTALLFGMAPQWIHIAYTAQALYYIPLRFYTYKRKNYAYFLADLCYFGNILALAYIWFFPQSHVLFVACYCLAHGSLATAVITWRNSLVFHDGDKMISMFIHIYPPLTLSVIRHWYGPETAARFPAIAKMPTVDPWSATVWSSVFYLIWQGLYWRLLLVRRREKIESGQRTTSFSYLLNDKRGPIGRMLRGVNPTYREVSFMAAQFGYSLVTQLPAIFLLYDSPLWTGLFLMLIFAVSVWNGGGYYIEVFGRKFERELEALRKELAASQSQSSTSSPLHSLPSSPAGYPDHLDHNTMHSPATTHTTETTSEDADSSEMPEEAEHHVVPNMDGSLSVHDRKGKSVEGLGLEMRGAQVEVGNGNGNGHYAQELKKEV